jgi:hypothetical protein
VAPPAEPGGLFGGGGGFFGGLFAGGGGGACGPSCWVGAEYLLWWIKNGPLPVPLVTTGNPFGANPGALTDPATRVLLGDRSFDYGPFSGLRITAGGWVEPTHRWGVEGSGFFLGQRSASAAVATPNGLTPLFVPFFSATLPGETALPITTPGTGTAAAVSSSSRLWGADVNGLFNVFRTDFYHVEALAGFRYLDLQESLNFNVVTQTPFAPLGGAAVLGSLTDSFGTRNQFYGPQIGGKAGVRWGRFTADLTAKVALGVMHESVNIAGQKSLTVPALPGTSFTVPGGIFAEPSNIGRRTQNEFAVIPEVGLQLGYNITSHLRTFVGYNFLYASNVARPGDQINRNLNLTQVLGTPPIGPAQPSPLFRHTDFWAQGITFGLEFRY